MKNHNNDTEQLVAMLDKLRDENLTLIDFDQLTSWLEEQKQRLESMSSHKSELETLREDYVGRLSGMAKAIAVADRKQGAMAQSAELVAGLPRLSAVELIDCYRRVSARFRDMFPASYTRQAANSTGGDLMRNPADFK